MPHVQNVACAVGLCLQTHHPKRFLQHPCHRPKQPRRCCRGATAKAKHEPAADAKQHVKVNAGFK